jgi:hypothetical protein
VSGEAELYTGVRGDDPDDVADGGAAGFPPTTEAGAAIAPIAIYVKAVSDMGLIHYLCVSGR